jgi:hypothetical protein
LEEEEHDEEGEEGEEEGDDDIEDKVDELEAELEDLRAEFEKLMSDDEDKPEGDDMDMDLDMDMGDEGEDEMESIEYDLDEAEAADAEEIEEATKLSDNVDRQPLDGKGVEEDSKESPFTKAPAKSKVEGAGEPVKAKDGGDGSKGESAKDHTPTDNIKVEPKKA